MKDDLAKRVEQFDLIELPGQPKMMHMGTSYLVHDLYREVRLLKKLLRDIAISNVEFDDEWVNYVTVQIDRTTWNKLMERRYKGEVRG